jgi:hypothetical protein
MKRANCTCGYASAHLSREIDSVFSSIEIEELLRSVQRIQEAAIVGISDSFKVLPNIS